MRPRIEHQQCIKHLVGTVPFGNSSRFYILVGQFDAAFDSEIFTFLTSIAMYSEKNVIFAPKYIK